MGRTLRVVLPFAVTVLVACAPEGPTAFVSYNVPIDAECLPNSESMTFLANGLYDIAPGANGLGTNCRNSYHVNLVVNSFLRSNQDQDLGRAEPNILQIHSAEVHLMDLLKRTIVFERDGGSLPNPFLVTTNNTIPPTTSESPSLGVAAVEAIPADYSEQLNNFANQQILAEIQVFGTTTGDVDVELKPFVYPIDICDGCLTECASPYLDSDGRLDVDEVYEGECPASNLTGADGRVCLDIDC